MLESNGLEMFIDDVSHRCPSVVSIKVPDNIDPHKVISYAMKNHYVEISGGLGPTAGQIFRYVG
jgi:alanine-glyoxylate transaminase/serine-glyoxylate transaminase/serine-pyruvate transaminase